MMRPLLVTQPLAADRSAPSRGTPTVLASAGGCPMGMDIEDLRLCSADAGRRTLTRRATQGGFLAMGAIVEAKNVVKTYRGKVAVPALNGVDLVVDQGEMVAIMGPSGCGRPRC